MREPGNPADTDMIKRNITIASILLLLILQSSGCGDPAQTRREMSGTWGRHIMSESGSYEGFLKLGTDGSFTFAFEGDVKGLKTSAGSYTLSGRDITFEDGWCGSRGRYRFLLKPEVLSFIPLGDGCGSRKAVLAGEWKRRDTREPAVN